MSVIKPYITIGQSNTEDVTQAISADADDIYIDTTNYTTADDHIIIGELISGEYRYEYLGGVTAKTGTYITTEYATSYAWTTSADVWKPTSTLQFDRFTATPETPVIPSRQDAFILTGAGVAYTSKMGVNIATKRVRFNNISTATLTSIIAWYNDTSEGASNHFWFFQNDRLGFRVLWVSDLSDQYLQSNNNGFYNLTMQLQINLTEIS